MYQCFIVYDLLNITMEYVLVCESASDVFTSSREVDVVGHIPILTSSLLVAVASGKIHYLRQS